MKMLLDYSEKFHNVQLKASIVNENKQTVHCKDLRVLEMKMRYLNCMCDFQRNLEKKCEEMKENVIA
jgi:hypothetical protein